MRKQFKTSDQISKLALYSTAVGASSLIATGLSAAIIDTGLSGSVSANPESTVERIEFDVTGDGENDFYLEARSRSGGTCGEATMGGIFNPVIFSSRAEFGESEDFGYAALVAPGGSIPAALQFNSFTHLWVDCTDPAKGNFPPPTRGFVGFRLPAGQPRGNGSADFLFGYADVEVISPEAGTYTATVHGIFFENRPGVPIQAGARGTPTEAVPVPVGGAVPLGLLLLAAGGLALRRRQRSESAN